MKVDENFGIGCAVAASVLAQLRESSDCRIHEIPPGVDLVADSKDEGEYPLSRVSTNGRYAVLDLRLARTIVVRFSDVQLSVKQVPSAPSVSRR